MPGRDSSEEQSVLQEPHTERDEEGAGTCGSRRGPDHDHRGPSMQVTPETMSKKTQNYGREIQHTR